MTLRHILHQAQIPVIHHAVFVLPRLQVALIGFKAKGGGAVFAVHGSDAPGHGYGDIIYRMGYQSLQMILIDIKNHALLRKGAMQLLQSWRGAAVNGRFYRDKGFQPHVLDGDVDNGIHRGQEIVRSCCFRGYIGLHCIFGSYHTDSLLSVSFINRQGNS
ncbi:hypothetical protein SDC9_143718 [bioreactor metagenome]|uniref:Uncharacterized protein n=1 Tax=bioreactor metagenome TaxID=1076179 RepID=A0A645E441_9ZZZZ